MAGVVLVVIVLERMIAFLDGPRQAGVGGRVGLMAVVAVSGLLLRARAGGT